MARWYLGLGSNLGDREANLVRAIAELGSDPRIRVVARSSLYDSAPVGPEQPRFLNAAIAIDTSIDAPALLHIAKEIEARLGRVPAERWGPRVIDIDILLGEARVALPDIVVPHPRVFERAFALLPLSEISTAALPDPTNDVRAQDCRRVAGTGDWALAEKR